MILPDEHPVWHWLIGVARGYDLRCNGGFRVISRTQFVLCHSEFLSFGGGILAPPEPDISSFKYIAASVALVSVYFEDWKEDARESIKNLQGLGVLVELPTTVSVILDDVSAARFQLTKPSSLVFDQAICRWLASNSTPIAGRRTLVVPRDEIPGPTLNDFTHEAVLAPPFNDFTGSL